MKGEVIYFIDEQQQKLSKFTLVCEAGSDNKFVG